MSLRASPRASEAAPLERAARAQEILDAETERDLALAWRDRQDTAALHRMVTAHLRLAISMAARYRRYGLAQSDLVQEAGLGLMRAAEKFDPDRGARFSTCATWWIRAALQDYLLRNWSMVRAGLTTRQRGLFFNLKRELARQAKLAKEAGEDAGPEVLRVRAAEALGVTLEVFSEAEARISSSDLSLDARIGADDEGGDWLERLEDTSPQADEKVRKSLDGAVLRTCLVEALSELSGRERQVVVERQLLDEPRTLAELGTELGLSKERVRQIEAAAFTKLRRALEARSPEIRQLLHS